MKTLLSAQNLSKRFGPLSALRNISLEIHQGEVLGVIGVSGSGKSTLAMLLAGIYGTDEGEIIFNGRQLQWPFRIRPLGIEIIYQVPRLAENLDITSNIFLGNEIAGSSIWNRWLNIPNQIKMDQEAARILVELGVSYKSLREKVSDLSGELRQMVAVAKVMTTTPELIIVDDPMRLISYPYQQKLLSLVQKWQNQGIAVLFTSNNLDHVLSVTDRFLVLRKGYRAAEFQTENANREEVIATMVGTTDYQKLIPIIWAMDSYYRGREQADRIRHSQTLIEQDIDIRDSLRNQLIDHLTEQITNLDSTNQALKNTQRRLMVELEKERKHLAREIHDQIIQDMLGANYQLEEVEAHQNVTPEIQHELSNIRNNIRGLIDELRYICGNLRPPTIDSLGLQAALQSFTRDWVSRTQIPLEFNYDEEIGRLPESIELSVYRIVQECLNNIQKHATANNVQVSLIQNSPRALMISIADDGRGLTEQIDFTDLAAQGHYGLLGINERVTLLGGRLRFQNKEDSGLLIQAEIPLPRTEAVT